MKRLLAVVLVAAVGCATSVAGVTARSPRQLVLQSSDLPSNAKRTQLKGLTGAVTLPKYGSVRPYGVAYRFRRGLGYEVVGSVAIVFPNTGTAQRAFTRTQRNNPKIYKKVTLPRLGDQQWSAGVFNPAATSIVAVVRTDEVVWETVVANGPGLSRSRATAELLKYARKQQARVG